MSGMEVLLEEAVGRLSAVSRTLGVRGPRAVGRGARRMVSRVDDLAEWLSPLTLPSDLVRFWTTWGSQSFEVLESLNVSLCPPEQARELRDHIVALEFPRVLLPIGGTQGAEFALELDTPTQPGSRLFRIDFHGENPLVGVGVADMLNLFSDALIRGHDPAGPMEDNAFFDALDRAAVDFGNVQVVPYDRGSWPLHWLIAEGFDEAWLRPRGRTHTIADFDLDREQASPVTGVLQGTWRTRAAGGSLGGDYGRLTDESGSVELLIPHGVPHAGLGPERGCEIEVVGGSRSGSGSEILPTACDLLPAVLSDDEGRRVDWMKRLDEAFRSLDVSIVATAVRPLP